MGLRKVVVMVSPPDARFPNDGAVGRKVGNCREQIMQFADGLMGVCEVKGLWDENQIGLRRASKVIFCIVGVLLRGKGLVLGVPVLGRARIDFHQITELLMLENHKVI